MGYYRKTCNYCGGNHAVMDCTKLQTDAVSAKQELEKYEDLEYFKAAIKANLMHDAYKYDQYVNNQRQYKLRPHFEEMHRDPSNASEVIRSNSWFWNRFVKTERAMGWLK